MKDPQKIYIKKNGTADIECPICHDTKTILASSFKDIKRPLKVQCTCGAHFQVRLEFRAMYRKKVNLLGTYTNLSSRNAQGTLLLNDLSLQGIGFTADEKHTIKKNDNLVVTFVLDDPHGTVITKNTTVVSVRKRAIGCEFESTTYDSRIGNYLLT
ncbi:MAG: hypothetical protein A2521_08825 [Deltaproteobacteria bacterium RIFOXYD12_FULL_57_12]|nr:MAG: hypothetical protein A2521_08825 [Deltaproteobacteria bacterium RIFOXYD12_FULL_57_12]